MTDAIVAMLIIFVIAAGASFVALLTWYIDIFKPKQRAKKFLPLIGKNFEQNGVTFTIVKYNNYFGVSKYTVKSGKYDDGLSIQYLDADYVYSLFNFNKEKKIMRTPRIVRLIL